MKQIMASNLNLLATALLIFGVFLTGTALATEPCGDFGECKALVEINSTDGDIGFHFMMDGEDLNQATIREPNGAKVFQDMAKGPLMEQKLTETFAESAEPLCWYDPEADADEDVVALEDFLDLWIAGTYAFHGEGDGVGKIVHESRRRVQAGIMSFSDRVILHFPANFTTLHKIW